jgi:hypothetical protein
MKESGVAKKILTCFVFLVLSFGFSRDTPAQNVSSAPKALPLIDADDTAIPITVDVKVDWKKTIGAMSPLMWGVCDNQIMGLEDAKDRGFNDYLKSLHRPLIRIHGGEQMYWLDAAKKTWDPKAIKACFDAAGGYRDAVLMMTFSASPDGIKRTEWGGFAAPEEEDRLVRFAAELVRIMRDTVKRKVDYWEFFNEPDGWDGKQGAWDKYGKTPELWRWINKFALAIKKEDPSAKVGAAAFTLPRPQWISGLVTQCGKNLDFISWHNYATGNAYASNEFIFGMIDEIVNTNREAVNIIRKYDPDGRLKIFLSEYNINWYWQIDDPRMRKSFGAVYDACLLKREALVGIDGAAIWHAKNWLYGLIGRENPHKSVKSNEINPSGYLYQWGIPYLVGRIAETRISDGRSVDCLPIITEKGKSLLLINKTRRAVVVPRAKRLLIPTKGETLRVMVIDSKGLSSPRPFEANADDLRFRGYSVTLLTTVLPEGRR